MIESSHSNVVCENKHIKIDNAIDRIDGVLARVNDICFRVSGLARPEDPSESGARPDVSLEELLTNGSSRIIKKCEEITKDIDRLEEMLF